MVHCVDKTTIMKELPLTLPSQPILPC